MDWSKYPNFTKGEFDCKHTGLNEMKPEFMEKLQALRLAYGSPMHITSGYRHQTHPVEARKGRSDGEHTRGLCCDVACSNGLDRYRLVKLAIEFGFHRIGIAKNFVHIGLGGQGLPSPVIWEYQ